MSRRAFTLVIGLILVVAACGAEAEPPAPETGRTAPLSAGETTSTTEVMGQTDVQASSSTSRPSTSQPSTSQPEDDYGVDPDAGNDAATTVSTAGTPPEAPVDVGGGKVIEPVPVDDATAPIVGEAPAALMESIMADLAAATGASPSDFIVIRAESVIWSDGSLGCPEPGVLYTQATVPGYWVVIDHAGAQYDYRANDRGLFVRCEDGSPPSGNSTK